MTGGGCRWPPRSWRAGGAGSCSGAASPTRARSPPTPAAPQATRPSTTWCTSRARAGRWRAAARRPSRRSGSPSTRCAAGPAGTATSPSPAWPTPSSPSCAPTASIRSLRRKRGISHATAWRNSRRAAGTHPLDGTRDPPPARPPVGRDTARQRGHLALVALAPSPPGDRPLLPLSPPRRPSTTTVVLGQAVGGGEAGGGGAGGDAELAVDGAQVRLDGVDADEEARADLLIGQPLGEQPEHLRLAGREAKRRGGRR